MLLGVIPQYGAVQGVATVPEVIWEAFLGLWLTFKGFKSVTITSLDRREPAIAPAHAAA